HPARRVCFYSSLLFFVFFFFFFFQAEDGIRDFHVTGVQTCALPIFRPGEEHQPLALEALVIEVDESLARRLRLAGRNCLEVEGGEFVTNRKHREFPSVGSGWMLRKLAHSPDL